MRSVLSLSVVACLALGSTAAAQAPATVVELEGLFPGGESRATAVNDAGLVVGVAQATPSSRLAHATVWVNGVAHDLGTLCTAPCPFEDNSSASDVNELGQVVGNSRLNDYAFRGFIWEAGKGFRILVPLDGDHSSVAWGINNRGEAVGNSQRILENGFYRGRPVIWTADGVPHELANWTTGQALDINDDGQIVGAVFNDDAPSYAVAWEQGIVTPLDRLPTACPNPSVGSFGRSFAINKFGHIAGDVVACSGFHYPAKWVQASAQALGLGSGVVGSDSNGSDSINDAGDVVGVSDFATGCPRLGTVPGANRATLWKNGARIDLGAVGDDPCASSRAAAINNHGLVVGESSPASGGDRAVVFRLNADLARGAFGGAPHLIPGRVYAEHYDVGGPGIGYSDTSLGNYGETYRRDDVDIKPSRHGGYAVGWLTAGEWLSYTVNVERADRYRISARVGSLLPGRTFHLEANGQDITGPIAVPQMADWDEYDTVTVDGVPLSAGKQTLRLVMGPEDYIDLQWIAFEPAGGTTPRVTVRIEAEDYDQGGQGYGYLDTTPGNEQGVAVYRDDDVDIKASAEGGYAIGWLAAGEWLTYTVAVPESGVYALRARVGSPLADRTFRIEVDGRDVTGVVPVQQRAGWDEYVTQELPPVALTPGQHVVRVLMGPEDFMDLQWLEISTGD
jgi:probable HAF family extracellular repeat protein